MVHLYFAYGSNMSLKQMRQRCPLSTKMGVAVLPGYALCFPRSSPVRNCGVAGIERRGGSVVWGVIYRLSPADLVQLDMREGHDPSAPYHVNRYNRHEVAVHVDGDTGRTMICTTYISRRENGVHLPSEDYFRLIITGAAENGLPAAYVAELRRTGAKIS